MIRKICIFAVLPAVVAGFARAAVQGESDRIWLQPGCELVFADIQTGQKVLTEPDMFTESVGPLLKAITLQSDEPVTTDAWLGFLKTQVREWTPDEKQRMRRAAEALSSKLKDYRPDLPETITLIKTTGRDMQNCAYCRYCAIVFPEAMTPYDEQSLERLLTHELFHVYSRYHLDWRTELYGLLEFKPCNEIELPAEIAMRELVNPDAPLNNYYVDIPYQKSRLDVLPIMLSPQPYDSKLLYFQWMAIAPTQLLVIEQQRGKWVPRLDNGEPVLLDLSQAMGFFKCIGLNTTYVLGVEEVLAENFTMLIQGRDDLPSPEIIEKLRGFLMGHQATDPSDVPNRETHRSISTTGLK